MPHRNPFPNLYLAGAPRSGTTFLFDLLSQSDDIYAAADKEPFYFCYMGEPQVVHDGKSLPNRKESYREADYLSLYADWGDERWGIDGSTYYLLDPECARRIHQCRPDARIIVVLREPISRAFSHYLAEKRDGWLSDDFGTALDKELAEIAQPGLVYAGHYHFVRGSRYARGLEAFVTQFGADNVRVIQFDELVRDPQRIVDRLCDYLGIARFVAKRDEVRRNESGMARNPLLTWVASRYRYSRARQFLSRIAPESLRTRVREVLMSEKPSTAPPPELTPQQEARLADMLEGEMDAALTISRQAGILL